MNKQTWAMPFYVDTALVAVGGLVGIAAAVGAELAVWHTAVYGMLAFAMTGLFIGVLHRSAVSPGQLLISGEHRPSERSTAAHALIFTSSAAMTALFMIGCAVFALTRIHRLVLQ